MVSYNLRDQEKISSKYELPQRALRAVVDNERFVGYGSGYRDVRHRQDDERMLSPEYGRRGSSGMEYGLVDSGALTADLSNGISRDSQGVPDPFG